MLIEDLIIRALPYNELGVIDFDGEEFVHIGSYKHSGSWKKNANNRWFAELTNYKSAKDQTRVFLTKQNNELAKSLLHTGIIIERAYNERHSFNYGHKYRSYYVIHKLTDTGVLCTVHDTPRRAFMARHKLEGTDISLKYSQQSKEEQHVGTVSEPMDVSNNHL